MIADWLLRAISNIVTSHTLSLTLLTGFNYYIFLHAKKTFLLRNYLLLSAGPFLWITGKLLKTISPFLGLRWVFIMVQYSGMSFIGPSFVVLCLTYLLQRRLKPLTVFMLYAPAIVCYILILSNPLHYRFYTVFTFYRDSFGPIFYLLKMLIFIYTGAAFIILAASFIKHKRKQMIQSLLFIAAAAAPLIGSLYYPNIGNTFSGLRFDIIPLCFNLTFLIFGIAIFFYDFLDIPPIAYLQLTGALTEGVVIHDGSNKPVYQNPAAEYLTGSFFRGNIRRSLHPLSKKQGKGEISMEIITDITAETGRKNDILSSTDKIRALSDSIKESIDREREILYMQQRNEAARELHDIMGHSLTLFIARMEALKLIENREERRKKYMEISEILPERIAEFESIMSGKNRDKNETRGILGDWLKTLVRSCESERLSIELVMRGDALPVDMEMIRNIYSAVRESITNSLRHGNADHVVISVNFGESCLIIVMDNGSGCSKITEGNGLAGIRKRMSIIGGTAEFSSTPDEGFITRLSFSVND